tara:strand:+ start:198 stop:404 length:207 start_codon:yes stop_codon:yes gene_type:complete
MEEVINILGSLNSWLPWANLLAIVMLRWSIQIQGKQIQSIEHDIDYLDRGVERLSGVIAKLMRRGKEE